jgi:3'-5' exonuclease
VPGDPGDVETAIPLGGEDEVTKMLGMPGKLDGFDGSRVEEMVLAGQIDEVVRYCESDVFNTLQVLLICELFRGAICDEQLTGADSNSGFRSEPKVA